MQMTGKPQIENANISEEHFLKIKQEAEEKYEKIGSVYCPYLKRKVNFNTLGLEHIKFKKWQKARLLLDQFIRFKLLYLVPEIVKNSHTLQGKLEKKEWERQKRHGKWEKLLINVTYFEFVAVIGKVRLKVIIKEIAGAEPHFISIIPFWRMVGEEGKKLCDSDIESDGDFTEDREDK